MLYTGFNRTQQDKKRHRGQRCYEADRRSMGGSHSAASVEEEYDDVSCEYLLCEAVR